MIEVKDLSTSFLSSINFCIKEREKVCILGPNGSGKSTLIKCIMALEKYLGKVLIESADIKSLKRIDIAKLIAYLPQNIDKLPAFTCLEFMSLSRFAKPKQDLDFLNTCLEETESYQFKDRKINSLSGGELQRVFLSSLLYQDTNYIILDEPSSHLDPKHSELIFKALARQKKSIVLVSHDFNSAAAFSDKTIALNKGKLFFSGKSSDFFKSSSLEQLYETSFEQAKVGGKKLFFQGHE